MEDDYGTSYYFRGAVENNYVKFGKNASGQDMYWRVIRINGDGSLRIIYDGRKAYANGESNNDRLVLTNIAWNTNYNDAKYVGYMYGGSNGEASTSKEQAQANETSTNIKTRLEIWYKENIVNTGYGDAISDEIFCNDRSTGKNAPEEFYDTGLGYGNNLTYYGGYGRIEKDVNNPQPSFKCPEKNDAFTVDDTSKGNGALKYPVGLITADEIVTAGSGKYDTTNKSYYLYKGTQYWSLSPHHSDSNAGVYFLSGSGQLAYAYIKNLYNVAPVINLSADYVSTLVGEGTMESPYHSI